MAAAYVPATDACDRKRRVFQCPAMPSKVFISYRRDDARYQARDIYEAFSRVLPREHVFMDVDTIAPGANFRKVLRGWVNECEVLLALIGPNWLNATDPKTKDRRLNNPSDFVRIEIGEALARGIPVVPVLIDDAPLPDIDLLPDDLKELVNRQAEFVEYRTFDSDCERLIRKLKLTEQSAQAAPTNPVVASPPIAPVDARVVQGAVGRRQVRWGWIGAAIAVGVTIAYIGVNNIAIPPGWRGSPNAVSEAGSADEQARAEDKRRADEQAKAEEDRKRAAASRGGGPAAAESKPKADSDRSPSWPAGLLPPDIELTIDARQPKGTPYKNALDGKLMISFEASGQWVAIPDSDKNSTIPAGPVDATGYKTRGGPLTQDNLLCPNYPLGALVVTADDGECLAGPGRIRLILKPQQIVHFVMNDVVDKSYAENPYYYYDDNSGNLNVKITLFPQ
jgi:hypothetical protein